MKKVIFLIVFAILILGCQKKVVDDTPEVTPDADTTGQISVDTEMDEDLQEIADLEKDLDLSELEDIESDLDQIDW